MSYRETEAGLIVLEGVLAHIECERFAELPVAERFHGVPYRETENGLIVLEGVLAHIECERYADFPLGDHTLFVGRVTGGSSGEGAPLLYYRGNYGSMRSL